MVGVALGLLARLRRRAPGDEKVTQRAIQLARDYLWCQLSEETEEGKIKAIASLVANFSSRDLARLEKPSPIDLLSESSNLAEKLSKLQTQRDRAAWLRESERVAPEEAGELACYKGAELLERVLAHRHGMSVSAIHKALAKAPKELQELRAARKGQR